MHAFRARRTPRGRRTAALAAVLLAVAALGTPAMVADRATARAAAGRASVPPATPGGAHDVIASLFEWNWPSVAAECATVLGPAGYGAVQVSPPEDSLSRDGHPWWEVYQPADYRLDSRLGTRHQFADMVRGCHAAGVRVYADAVVNHMTGQGSTSYDGVSFDKYDYPGLYSSDDFHHYPDDCPEPDNQIHDYGNVTEVQHCELSNLADLRTGSGHVRDAIAGYLNDLISLGVDGFRIDAAKHIGATDLAAIESRLSRQVYVYQEVPPGGAVTPEQFESTGDLVGFTYADKLREQFDGNIANLRTFGRSWGLEPADKAVVMVANHDTERDGSTLSYSDGAAYTLATVFSLAWGYGTPKVYSGFDFAGRDDSPPADAAGYVRDTTCGNGWECTDRWTPVAGMVGFHNVTRGAAVGNWWDNGSDVIAFSRGRQGWVAINNSDGPLTHTFATGLPAGTYCDLIGGGVRSDACVGTAFTVGADGNATVRVPAHGAVAGDVAATVPGPPADTVSVTFHEHAITYWGQQVFVTGSVAALGSWQPSRAVPLSSADYPQWSVTVSLPADSMVEYKFLKKNPDGTVTWESDPNRTCDTGTSPSMTIDDTWR